MIHSRHTTVPEGSFVVFRYSLSSSVTAVSPITDEMMHLIGRFGGAEENEIDIEIALREALLNAVIHGNHEDPHKHVFLKLRCDSDGEVSIMLRDEGAGFDIGSVPDPTAPEQLMSNHGRGICLMRALMDEVSFEEGGTVVRMCKKPKPTDEQLRSAQVRTTAQAVRRRTHQAGRDAIRLHAVMRDQPQADGVLSSGNCHYLLSDANSHSGLGEVNSPVSDARPGFDAPPRSWQ